MQERLIGPTRNAGDFSGSLPTKPEKVLKTAVLALLAITLLIGSLLIQQLMPLSWNIAVTRAMQSVTFPGLHELMRLISGFGNAPKVIAITAIVLIASNKRRQAVFLTLCGLGGWFLAMQLKNLFGASRPDPGLVTVFHQWPNGSFPSGHLVFYVCYFGFLFSMARHELPPGSVLRRCLMILTLMLIVMVGVSRVYLGEHWLSDLPGSYTLGAICLAIALRLQRAWLRARRRQHDWFLPYRTADR